MSRTLSMNCRVGRELERFRLVRLQPERPPDAADRRLAHPGRGRHRPRRPVRRVRGLLLERLHDHPLDLGIGDRARLAGPRLIVQTVEPAPGEAATPLPNGRRIAAQLGRDLRAREPVAAASTIRQRNASACELFGRRAHRSSTSRSSPLTTTSARAAITAPNRRRLTTTAFDADQRVPAN